MFWSGNYIANKDLSSLLKEENINLTDVLEADNILQECKADNQALTKYLSRPEILSELIRLITEEPPKDVDLMLQYRHATIACEVLASFTSKMKQLLVKNVSLLHRLCDFVNCEPPLNPLLASYFSKVIEVLLEKDPSQNGYVYRIVCLQVLDVFCARPEFLPNLLRHMSTSAIAEVFKYFIRLEDYFYKGVMQWFEEHKLVDCLIQIVAGTYAMEESSIKLPPDDNHTVEEKGEVAGRGGGENTEDDERAVRSRERMRTAAADNAEALLRELVLIGCVKDPYDNWSPVARTLATAVRGGVGRALSEWFSRPEPRTSPPAGLIVAALTCHTSRTINGNEQGTSEECCLDRASVEYCVAPHLPLIHQQLMSPRVPNTRQDNETGSRKVGSCRLALVSVLGELATSHVPEVPTTLLTLGTPGLLVDLFFSFPHNNLLHQAVCGFVSRAMHSPYATQFAQHFLVECDFLGRLMDAFEENEKRSETGLPRAGYMGHVILLLSLFRRVLEQDGSMSDMLVEDVQVRWHTFTQHKLDPLLHIHQTPLGGVYPSDNTYEEPAEMEPETVYDNIDYDKDSFKMMDIDRDMEWSSPKAEDEDDFEAVLADVPPELLDQSSPWESINQDAELSNEQWANFNDVFGSSDPFANANQQAFQLPNQGRDHLHEDYEATNHGFDSVNQNYVPPNDNERNKNNIFENSVFTNRRLDFDEKGGTSSESVKEKGDRDGGPMNVESDRCEQDDDRIESVEFKAKLSPSWSYSASVSNDCDGGAAITNLAKIIQNLNITQSNELDANVVSTIADAAGAASDAKTDGVTDSSEPSPDTAGQLAEGKLGTKEEKASNVETTKLIEVLADPQTNIDLIPNAGSEPSETALPDTKNNTNVQNTTDINSLTNSIKLDSSSINLDANYTNDDIKEEIDVINSEFEEKKNIIELSEQLLDETQELMAKTDKLLSDAAKTSEKSEVNANLVETDINVKTNIVGLETNVNVNIGKSETNLAKSETNIAKCETEIAKFETDIADLETVVKANIAQTETTVNIAQSETTVTIDKSETTVEIAKPEPSVDPKITETEPSER